MVGDYRIVEKIGSGGSGTVFKAERAGQFFAVKMLRLTIFGARERREMGILLHLDNPGVARFRACDRWLDPKIGTPYIVTDFVPGLTLEEYAEVKNPSARKSARIILKAALTLGEVHLQGVFHRDLKPENIIIHGKTERPVLIDFGVGTYVGAPVITPYGLPPGTYEFRAPEAYRFTRENPELGHYEFSAADELWALGVSFYWLLTNVLPFGDRNDWEGGGLAERILHMTPVAPHILNPRVPRALSDICMKMLEKKPEDRYASVAELCAVLGSALADAELDGRWNLPLLDPDALAPQTTEEPARADEDEDETLHLMRKWARAQPRRGRKPKKEAKPVEPPKAPTPPETPRGTPVPRPPASRHRARLAAAAGLAIVLLWVALLVKRTEPAPEPTLVAVSKRETASLLSRFTDRDPLPQACFVREVVPPWMTQDSVGGAAPVPGTSTPAPFAIAMLRKDDTSLKTTKETRDSKTQKQGLPSLLKKGCVGAACCATLAGCSGAQVRPVTTITTTTPEPEPCPDGAVETMEKLGIYIGYQKPATFLMPPARYFTVQEGDTALYLIDHWGKLPQKTLLSGRLLFGDKRVYGRLTEAKVPNGETYKVCMEVWDETGGRGSIRKPDGGPESARIFSTVDVTAVSRFK
jgi:serine/threonine-protein kinase